MQEETVQNPTRRFTVSRAPQGWDVREEEDSQVVRRIHCKDWHRVERALAIFTLERDEAVHSTKR